MTNHLAIPVKDMEESKKFYNKLGFEEFKSWEKPEQELRGVWMRDSEGYTIELNFHSSNKELFYPKMVEVHHLGIAVKNLEEKIKTLMHDGIKIVVPITKGVSVKKFAFIRDPNGFPIELVE